MAKDLMWNKILYQYSDRLLKLVLNARLNTLPSPDNLLFAGGTSIGSCKLVRGKHVTTTRVRLRITQAPVCPAISEFALFAERD